MHILTTVYDYIDSPANTAAALRQIDDHVKLLALQTVGQASGLTLDFIAVGRGVVLERPMHRLHL